MTIPDNWVDAGTWTAFIGLVTYVVKAGIKRRPFQPSPIPPTSNRDDVFFTGVKEFGTRQDQALANCRQELAATEKEKDEWVKKCLDLTDEVGMLRGQVTYLTQRVVDLERIVSTIRGKQESI